MPVTWAFDDRIVVMKMVGRYGTGDLKDAILAALDDPACPSAPVLMFDLRASESVQRRTAEEIRDIAQFLAARASRFGRRLAMVTAGAAQFGLMRMGSVIAEQGGLPGEVFRGYDEAKTWLLSGFGATTGGDGGGT
jgi:hypothetical protein